MREDETHALQFAYDAEWLDQGGFPISVNLPLSNGDKEVDAHAFFEGLLPEGRVRQRICRQRKIATETHFSSAQINALAQDTRIIRNRQKIIAVTDNARFILHSAEEHGSFAKMVARWTR